MIRPFRVAACLLLPLLSLTLPAAAQPLATQLFGAVRSPTAGPADPIGSYSRGCAGGLVQMPGTGPTWQMMRLSRDRNWGNPEMVSFLEDLSRYAATQPGWKGLYIGDIGQPRGGPMASGHASHQIGLDADVWYLPPKSVRLSVATRERISANSVRTADQTRTNANWTPANKRVLERAAKDPRVDRIFVAAAVKIAMCNSTPRNDSAWLQKIRPWYGHNDHFHVRLKCPPGARDCIPQTPTVAELSHGGNGCDASLNWWVTTYLENLRHPPPRKKSSGPPKPRPRTTRSYILSDLPAQCAAVLSAR